MQPRVRTAFCEATRPARRAPGAQRRRGAMRTAGLRRAGAWERRGGACAWRRQRPDPLSDPEPAARCGGAVRRRRTRGTRLVQHREAAAKPVQPGVEIVGQRVGVGRRRGARPKRTHRILHLRKPRQPHSAGRGGQQEQQSCRAPHGARRKDRRLRMRPPHVLLTSRSRSSAVFGAARVYPSQLSCFSESISPCSGGTRVSSETGDGCARHALRDVRVATFSTLLSSSAARTPRTRTAHA